MRKLILTLMFCMLATICYAEKYYIIYDISANLTDEDKGDIIQIVPVKDRVPLTENELRNNKVLILNLSKKEADDLRTVDSGGLINKKIDVKRLKTKKNNEEIEKTDITTSLTSKSITIEP